MSSHGMRSPPPPSPRPSFDTESLQTYIKKLLASTLQGATFPAPRDRDRTKAWCKEIGDRVKERMIGMPANVFFGRMRALFAYLLNIHGRHDRNSTNRIVSDTVSIHYPWHGIEELTLICFSKYIVLTRVDENCGQGGQCVTFTSCSLHIHSKLKCFSANLICHWEDCDKVAQELFSNVLLRSLSFSYHSY